MATIVGYPNLKPFAKGDGRTADRSRGGQNRGVGRPSQLDDPEKIEAIGKALAEGLTREEVGDLFNVSIRTVSTWRADPRVKHATLKQVEDRIIRVTRRTDSKLDSLLASDAFNELAVEDQVALLLKVRKEMLGGVLRMQAESGKVDSQDVNAALDAMESDPAFARELEELMARTAPDSK